MEFDSVIEEEDSKEVEWAQKMLHQQTQDNNANMENNTFTLLYVRITKKNMFQISWIKFRNLRTMILNKTSITKNSWSKR